MSSRLRKLSHSLNPYLQNLICPKPSFPILSTPFSTSFVRAKLPYKKPRKKKPSARTTPIQSLNYRIPSFEYLVERDTLLRFVTRSKDFLAKQPMHVIRLDDAGKLHRELGFARGRKVSKWIDQHSLLFQVYRHDDGKLWMGFTDVMEKLLEEEEEVVDDMEVDRVVKVRKLLMMSVGKRIALSKIYHCRNIFGISEDFRDRIFKYPNYFRIVVENDGKRVLELVDWDPKLAVSTLEKDFVWDEDRVKGTFKFKPECNSKARTFDHEEEEEEEEGKYMKKVSGLPLVSPYSDGSGLKRWSLEAEKYRLGVIHEFLSLTLEKRASIHHIVEFKEEFGLTKHTYEMLRKQPRTFYLAGTEMNWAVFLREGYTKKGELIEKDPQVVFNEKLYRYALSNQTEVVNGSNEEAYNRVCR